MPLTVPRWSELVERVQEDDAAGVEQLYNLLSKGVRFYLCRQLGPQDLEDKVQDTFLAVSQAIRNRELREPERLMGFVKTVMRRQAAAHVEQTASQRRLQAEMDVGLAPAPSGSDPEQQAIQLEREQFAAEVLRSISTRDREILTRFYLKEQTPDQICREMDLTFTQFRLLKSRAKARFGRLGKKTMARRRTHADGVRIRSR